jgi:hypothetical protein
MYEEGTYKRKREEVPSFGDRILDSVAALGRAGLSAVRYSMWGLWLALKWSAIGAWKATAFMAGLAWAVMVWTALLPWRMLRGLWQWWRGPEPYFENERERDIYRRIRRRFRRRNRFRLHTLIYLLFNGMIWLDWLTLPRFTYAPAWPFFAVLIGWGAVLLFHYLYVRSAEAEDNALDAALERERAYADRQRRDSERYLRLVDEAGTEMDDETQRPAKRKRR